MMSTSGDFESENNHSVAGVSFWDIKQYSKTLRRLENANKLCTDICNMLQDRVEIEKSYSSSLKKWSGKWSSYLENGAEYGTTKQCWLGFCREADNLSEIHKEIRSRLIDEAQSEVRNWQREHYHKATLPPQNLKEVKALEADFEIAQKSWSKKLKKMNQTKKDFHQQCKMMRSYEVQNKNASNDTSVSSEQLKKMEEKLRKTEKDMEKCKSQYEASLQDLENDSNRYVEEMTKVFQKSQEMERERMFFFKSVFVRIQEILNLSDNNKITETYDMFNQTNQSLDAEADISYWSSNYGADMPFHCPIFEEYTADLHPITKKKPTGGGGVGSPLDNGSGGVTLTAINSHHGDMSTPTTPATTPSYALPPSRPRPVAISTTTASLDTTGHSSPNSPPAPQMDQDSGNQHSTGIEPGGTPQKPRRSKPSLQHNDSGYEISHPLYEGGIKLENYEEEDDRSQIAECMVQSDYCFNDEAVITPTLNNGHELGHIKDSGAPSPEEGVPVRALYDYQGVEDDELSLKQGDIFYKLEDEDEQGWCRGKKDGNIGLYPANYAEEI